MAYAGVRAVRSAGAGYQCPSGLFNAVYLIGYGGLEAAKDFPNDAPVLVITDGGYDRLTLRGEHAFLMPLGMSLPFKPRGPVFRMG